MGRGTRIDGPPMDDRNGFDGAQSLQDEAATLRRRAARQATGEKARQMIQQAEDIERRMRQQRGD